MHIVQRNGLAGLIILTFFWLALSSLVDDSPVMDEQNHLGRGIAYLNSGDPRLNVEHPPVVNLLAALPTLLLDLDIPFDSPAFQERVPPQTFWYSFAESLFWERNNGNDVEKMIFLGRLPILFLTISLGLLSYHFAYRLWGYPAGLIALSGVLFDPNIITNGRYITTDLGGTFFILLATFAIFQRVNWKGERINRGKCDWSWTILIWSLFIGLAFGAKLTSILFIPIWIILVLLPVNPGENVFNKFRLRQGDQQFTEHRLPTYWRTGYRSTATNRVTQLAAAGLLSLLVLWGIYGFEWGHFLFLSEGLQPYNRFQGPMPTFWSGIERITVMSSGGSGRYAFLLGRFSLDGFWYYFPIAFLAKTPLITLIGLTLSIVFLIFQRENRIKVAWLLIPIFGYFLLAMNSSLNIGYRHLLPILPFVYILISGGMTSLFGTVKRRNAQDLPITPHFPTAEALSPLNMAEIEKSDVDQDQPSKRNSPLASYWSLVTGYSSLLLFPLALLATSFSIHPHYISYFNQLFGGPENGYNVLIDSNVDWGQDLKRLEWWMYENGVSVINLGWYGSSDPAQLGINFRPIPGFPRPEFLPLWWDVPFDRENPAPGVYAISVYNYWEMPLKPEEKTVYAWFREREPDAQVGYSIFIYIVE